MKTTLTRDEAAKKLVELLREAGVEMALGGCGCCGSPWVTIKFPDGSETDLDGFRFDTKEPNSNENSGQTD